MEMIYYTVAAVLLYLVSDWTLNRIEIYRGQRLPYRSLIFFAIILLLSITSFSLISAFYQKQDAAVSTKTEKDAPAQFDTIPK